MMHLQKNQKVKLKLSSGAFKYSLERSTHISINELNKILDMLKEEDYYRHLK
jgi:hypothetical protein